MNGNFQNSKPFSGDIDPDIAKLMGISTSEPSDKGTPQFSDLFEGGSEETSQTEEEDYSKGSFPEITKFEDAAKPYFQDKDFYKKVLTGEGEEAQRLHSTLTEFINSKDPKDKTLYRGKLISAYWNFITPLAGKIEDLSLPKILALRYGILLPNLLTMEHLQALSKIIFENEWGEPVFYMDEWLKKLASGQVNPSATDETKSAVKSAPNRLQSVIEKTSGQREFQFSTLKNKINELELLEDTLKDAVTQVLSHDINPAYNLKESFNALQRKAITDIQEIFKRLNSLDKEISKLYLELSDTDKQLGDLRGKAQESGVETRVDSQVLINEFNTLKQMIKLCVGRQGNHFPFLMKQYVRALVSDYCTRENAISTMAFVESLDPGLFQRTFKRQTTRIVPNVILVPCYGDKGICWEPFEKYNRATSRGRIALPLYPKDIKTSVISALGDLRWQVAKEKAQHYWMEEGLTGKYYQWFTERKLKGDVKEYFTQDYILWITKESEGTQKLERDVRAIFWRYIPFPQELKDSLKNRGFVYSELCKKDLNRAASDGY